MAALDEAAKVADEQEDLFISLAEKTTQPGMHDHYTALAAGCGSCVPLILALKGAK